MERSPFAFRLVDYSGGLTPSRRMVIGLVHLGIAAIAYPRESDLEDDIVVRRSVEQVERFLRDACQVMASAEEEQDAVAGAPEEVQAWREFLSMPSSKRMAKGGFSPDCTMGQIARAFDWLVVQGMARQSGDTYQLLDRYRVQVRELAGHAALERLRAIQTERAAEELPTAPPPGEVPDEPLVATVEEVG
jgi:hypothetical protein